MSNKLQDAEAIFNAIEPSLFTAVGVAFPQLMPFLGVFARSVQVAEKIYNDSAQGGMSVGDIAGDLVKQITPGQPNIPILGPESTLAHAFAAPAQG